MMWLGERVHMGLLITHWVCKYERPGRRTLSMENMALHEGSLANSLQEDAKVMVLC
ncbi:hypothetical protein ACQJBY_022915 [Aegilops geniculata]